MPIFSSVRKKIAKKFCDMEIIGNRRKISISIFLKYFSYDLFQEDSHWDVKHNQSAKGFNSSPKINGISNNASQSPGGNPPGPPPMAVNPPHHQVNLGPQNLGPQKLGPNLPTKQYNSPKHMYSDEAIQEIMAQQAEVLAGGVKG